MTPKQFKRIRTEFDELKDHYDWRCQVLLSGGHVIKGAMQEFSEESDTVAIDDMTRDERTIVEISAIVAVTLVNENLEAKS